MKKVRASSEDLCVLVFISLSKSVSRGLTTAGAIISNHTREGKELLQGVADTCTLLDTLAKPDQMLRLVENHTRVVERCEKAYSVAARVGESLRKVVLEIAKYDMP